MYQVKSLPVQLHNSLKAYVDENIKIFKDKDEDTIKLQNIGLTEYNKLEQHEKLNAKGVVCPNKNYKFKTKYTNISTTIMMDKYNEWAIEQNKKHHRNIRHMIKLKHLLMI